MSADRKHHLMDASSFLYDEQDTGLAEPRIDEASRRADPAVALQIPTFECPVVISRREDATMRKIVVSFAVALGVSVIGIASQQYPVVDALAGKIVQKYQGSTCDQLWQERSQSRSGQPKSPHEQQAIQMLQNNPQMRAEFINRVAAPIANKMFECGMIP